MCTVALLSLPPLSFSFSLVHSFIHKHPLSLNCDDPQDSTPEEQHPSASSSGVLLLEGGPEEEESEEEEREEEEEES